MPPLLMPLRTPHTFIELNRFNDVCCNIAGQLAWPLSSSRHNLRLDHDDCAKHTYESVEHLGWIEVLVAVDYLQKLVTEVLSGGGQDTRLWRPTLWGHGFTSLSPCSNICQRPFLVGQPQRRLSSSSSSYIPAVMLNALFRAARYIFNLYLCSSPLEALRDRKNRRGLLVILGSDFAPL
jgi:hypothetical protein